MKVSEMSPIPWQIKIPFFLWSAIYWTLGALLIIALFLVCCILHPIEAARAIKAAVWE